MKSVFYRKTGRKYEPVSEYDSELMSAFPRGAHIVMTVPGGRSTRYNIDPALGPMIAAGKYAEDAISQRLMEVSAMRIPERDKPLTKEQIDAWHALNKAMGNDRYALEYCSYREAAEEGVKAMIKEAEEIMLDPTVQAAWDHFLLLAKLAKEQKHGT